MVNHLLGSKVRHTHIVLVNLRNDLMVECDGATYSIRHAAKIDEPIIYPGLNKTELEVTILNFVALASCHLLILCLKYVLNGITK